MGSSLVFTDSYNNSTSETGYNNKDNMWKIFARGGPWTRADLVASTDTNQ